MEEPALEIPRRTALISQSGSNRSALPPAANDHAGHSGKAGSKREQAGRLGDRSIIYGDPHVVNAPVVIAASTLAAIKPDMVQIL